MTETPTRRARDMVVTLQWPPLPCHGITLIGGSSGFRFPVSEMLFFFKFQLDFLTRPHESLFF